VFCEFVSFSFTTWVF
uniref:Uncharacterized protein n=1 Tax=Anopheles funestus TaxID=62324 RepID=A0A182S0H7_ANOFN